MRAIGALILFLALAITVRAEDWTTADGRVYKGVVVVAAEDDGVRIKYDGGVGKIPYYELSDDLLKRFGQDAASLAAKKAAADKAAADAAMKTQQEAAELKKEKEEAAAAQAATNPASQANSGANANSGAGANANSGGAAGGKSGSSSSSGSGAHPGQPGVNPSTGNATEAAAPPPPPPFSPTVAPTEDNPYPHSKFQYDEGIDQCFLDSYTFNVSPIMPDPSAATAPQLQGGTIYFRVATEGKRAEAPDIVTGMFVSNAPLKKLADNHKVKFLVDGVVIQGEPNANESDTTADKVLQTTQVIFTVNAEQAKAIARGKIINVSVGSYDYRVDDSGLVILRGYQDDVDNLPPPSTNLARSYHRLLNKLPSIITMISTTCEYIILGAFGIIVVASIAAFIMGLTRFIKM
jgi:hypothetical protein